MKKYSYSIEVDYTNNSKKFANDLIAEVEDEKRQLALTHKINGETMRMHSRILRDFAEELNLALEFANVKFGEVIRKDRNSNLYYEQGVRCLVDQTYYYIKISADTNEKCPDSKYTTYMGGYNLHIGSSCYSSFESLRGADISTKIETIDDALNCMRGALKRQLVKVMV